MSYKFLDTKPLVSGGAGNIFTKSVPKGRYSGIRLTITGSTAAGETLTLDDLGDIIVDHSEAGQIGKADIGFLNRYVEIEKGRPATVSGSAESEERVVATYPFGTKKFPNVEDVPDDNTVSIKLQLKDTLATRFGGNSANVRIDMIEAKDVAQTYRLKIGQQDQQSNSAGTQTDDISGRNTAYLFLRDPDEAVDKLQLVVDSETLVDNTPFGVLLDDTNIENEVEHERVDWVKIPIAQNPVVESAMNNAVGLQTTFSGAGNMELYKFQFDWLPQNVQQRNIAKVNAYLENKGRTQ